MEFSSQPDVHLVYFCLHPPASMYIGERHVWYKPHGKVLLSSDDLKMHGHSNLLRHGVFEYNDRAKAVSHLKWLPVLNQAGYCNLPLRDNIVCSVHDWQSF